MSLGQAILVPGLGDTSGGSFEALEVKVGGSFEALEVKVSGVFEALEVKV